MTVRVPLLAAAVLAAPALAQAPRAPAPPPAGGRKPLLSATSVCQARESSHSGRSDGCQRSASGRKPIPAAAQYARTVSAGRRTRSAESITTGARPVAWATAA